MVYRGMELKLMTFIFNNKTMKQLRLLILAVVISGCGATNITRYETCKVIGKDSVYIDSEYYLSNIKLQSLETGRTYTKRLIVKESEVINDTVKIKLTFNPFNK